MKKKLFECQGGCKERGLEMVVLGCRKCIKKTAPLLSLEQKDIIDWVLTTKKVELKKMWEYLFT